MSAFGSTPLPELRKKLDEAKARYVVAATAILPIQNEISQLQTAISESLTDTAKSLYKAGGKLSGDLTITTGSAGKFKASISKTVNWDTAKLQAVATELPWEKALAIFKIDFSVPEAKFKLLTEIDKDLVEKLTDARTVKYGDLKIVAID